MEHRAPGSSSVSAAPQQSKSNSNPGAWIITAYALSGIGALAVMAYYFSNFITH